MGSCPGTDIDPNLSCVCNILLTMVRFLWINGNQIKDSNVSLVYGCS